MAESFKLGMGFGRLRSGFESLSRVGNFVYKIVPNLALVKLVTLNSYVSYVPIQLFNCT